MSVYTTCEYVCACVCMYMCTHIHVYPFCLAAKSLGRIYPCTANESSAQVCLFVWFVCVCVYTFVHVCACACGGQRTTSGVIPQTLSAFPSETKSLSHSQSFPSRLACELQGSPISAPSTPGLVCHHAFSQGFWGETQVLLLARQAPYLRSRPRSSLSSSTALISVVSAWASSLKKQLPSF